MGVKVTKRKKPYTTWDKGLVAAAIFMILIVIYPLWYVIINAISDPEMVSKGLIKWWPVKPDLVAFQTILFDVAFYRAILVTLFFAVTGIFLTNVANLFVAYPLAKRNLRGKKFVVAFLVGSMYFGGGFLPQFILMNRLGLYNTPWAIILPNIGASMGLIALYKTFIQSVATDLMDAAMIDGASNYGILFNVVVPVIKPAIAVQVMQQIVGHWNAWFGINVYLPERKWQNVQLYLSRMIDGLSPYSADELAELVGVSEEQLKKLKQAFNQATRVRYASMLLVALPLLAVYPFMQKNLAQGIMVGSLKG